MRKTLRAKTIKYNLPLNSNISNLASIPNSLILKVKSGR